MKIVGYVLLAIGGVILIAGLAMSGAAEYSDTLNVGLLNTKTNLVLAGGFTAVVGAVFTAVAFVLQAIGLSSGAQGSAGQ